VLLTRGFVVLNDGGGAGWSRLLLAPQKRPFSFEDRV